MTNRKSSLSTDYEGRCGNCHAELGKDAQYCRYCGTKRGEGKFKPYKNQKRIKCLYGPPIKLKYKCPNCGYQWITYAIGGDHNKFCPMCRTILRSDDVKGKTLNYIDVVGLIIEDVDKILLFTEDEVKRVLDVRSRRHGSKNWHNDMNTWLLEAGFTEFKRCKDWQRLTEWEADRINLARYMMYTKGENPFAYAGVSCPSCSGTCICALEYIVYGDGLPESGDLGHIPGPGDEIYCSHQGVGHLSVTVTNPDKLNKRQLAFRCLQCGHDFGNFVALYNQQKSRT